MHTMSNNHTNMNYDEAFAALEEVLRSLESGELPLEQALALYEDGVALATLCSQKLEDAELRVRQWQGRGQPQRAAPGCRSRGRNSRAWEEVSDE